MAVTKVFASPMKVAQVAADLIAEVIGEAVGARDRCTIALSGGSTPIAAYKLLSQPPYSKLDQWSKTHLFWGDERCVPADDERNNARVALEALGDLGRIAHSYPIDTSKEARLSAVDYEELLRSVLGDDVLDLVLLGLGSDGHTASLFPGSPALELTDRTVVDVEAPTHIEPMVPRVTLTLATINAARRVVFLVTGAGKADVAKAVLSGKDPRAPAALICPEGELFWLLDQAASP